MSTRPAIPRGAFRQPGRPGDEAGERAGPIKALRGRFGTGGAVLADTALTASFLRVNDQEGRRETGQAAWMERGSLLLSPRGVGVDRLARLPAEGRAQRPVAQLGPELQSEYG